MKHHLTTLDGLRGLAALSVLASHFHLFAPNSIFRAFEAGYLSVDFFFILSGFVIAMAYEQKLAADMSVVEFLRRRFERLYPMLFAGSVVGAIVVLAGGWNNTVPVAFLAQALLLPGLGGAGGLLFPLNGVMWTLFWEVSANAVHALALRWASNRVLLLMAIVCGVGMILVARIYGSGGGGWGRSLDSLVAGGVRIGFSYPLGVLLYRLHAAGRLPRWSLPFPILAMLLVAVVMLGSAAGHQAVRDPLVAIVVWPMLICLSVHAKLGDPAPVATWLGAISYPLYALHQPLVHAWHQWAPPSPISMGAAFMGIVLFAALMERLYERRAVRWLRLSLPRAAATVVGPEAGRAASESLDGSR